MFGFDSILPQSSIGSKGPEVADKGEPEAANLAEGSEPQEVTGAFAALIIRKIRENSIEIYFQLIVYIS